MGCRRTSLAVPVYLKLAKKSSLQRYYTKPRYSPSQLLNIILQLLDPTSKKQNIFFKNIAEAVKNRQSIADLLKAGETKLSSADFKKHELPSAVKNQNIREVKALYKAFTKSDFKKENLEFKANQPICYNKQNYKIDGHIIEIPLY